MIVTFYLFLYHTLWKQIVKCRPQLRGEDLYSTLLSEEYLHKLFAILYQKCVTSHIHWLINSVLFLYQYGFIDIYILNYNPILWYLFCCNFAIESYFSWSLCPFDIFVFCLFYHLITFWTSLVAQTIKNLPAMQETQVQSLIWEDSLEKGMATHSSILACRIPWTEEHGGL